MNEQTTQNISASIPAQLQTTEEAGKLESLLNKYKVSQPSSTPRTTIHKEFDKTSSRPSGYTRLGSAPKVSVASTQTGDIYAEMAGIQDDLTQLAEEYGKLNVDFKNLIGKGKIFTLGDAAEILFYKTLYRPFGGKAKAREVKMEAARRKGNTIELLVNRMTEVLVEQYEKAVKGKSYAETVQVENIAHMRKLDETLIARLRESYVSGSDLTAREDEVRKIEKELFEIDSVLGDLETKVQYAKSASDIQSVRDLTDKMSQVLEVKYQVLDGKLSAEGEVSETRRQMLSSAEGVQSAKGATAASKVNYKAITAWIDAMNELVFKYQHAKEDFIPVFKIQGKIAAGGMEAMQMRDTLLKVSEISQKLMEANSRLVQRLSTEVFELVKTPLYDVERAQQVEVQLTQYMEELNQQKKEWAEAQQSLLEDKQTPHYAQPH